MCGVALLRCVAWWRPLEWDRFRAFVSVAIVVTSPCSRSADKHGFNRFCGDRWHVCLLQSWCMWTMSCLKRSLMDCISRCVCASAWPVRRRSSNTSSSWKLQSSFLNFLAGQHVLLLSFGTVAPSLRHQQPSLFLFSVSSPFAVQVSDSGHPVPCFLFLGLWASLALRQPENGCQDHYWREHLMDPNVFAIRRRCEIFS